MRISKNGSLAVTALACLVMAPAGAFGQSGSITGAGSTFVNPLMSVFHPS
jgi:ABC-type phosphate transport system substrate-binding protein